MEEQGTGIRVEARTAEYAQQASAWAERLGLPLQDDTAAFAVQVGADGLQIQQLGPQAPGPVRVDFVEGQAAHRRQFGGGNGQMIAKAVGIAQGIRPQVLDATAGLGKDAFVLASLGCQMTLIERQPLIAALLEDGLARARADEEVGPIVGRMRLLTGNAIEPRGCIANYDEFEDRYTLRATIQSAHGTRATLVAILPGLEDDAEAMPALLTQPGRFAVYAGAEPAGEVLATEADIVSVDLGLNLQGHPYVQLGLQPAAAERLKVGGSPLTYVLDGEVVDHHFAKGSIRGEEIRLQPRLDTVKEELRHATDWNIVLRHGPAPCPPASVSLQVLD